MLDEEEAVHWRKAVRSSLMPTFWTTRRSAEDGADPHSACLDWRHRSRPHLRRRIIEWVRNPFLQHAFLLSPMVTKKAQ